MAILWEGKSEIDQSNIVVIGTTGSRNRKTGDMAQVWILSADHHPTEAQRNGGDVAICGDCPIKAGCYVVTANGPAAIWRKYLAGGYRRANRVAWGQGKRVRLGAYGDPAAIPHHVVREILKKSIAHTGYSHQWDSKIESARDNARAMRDIVMASVESIDQALKAREIGFRTFRVSASAAPEDGEIICPHERNSFITCSACGQCDGANTRKKTSGIVVSVHGAKRNRISDVVR